MVDYENMNTGRTLYNSDFIYIDDQLQELLIYSFNQHYYENDNEYHNADANINSYLINQTINDNTNNQIDNRINNIYENIKTYTDNNYIVIDNIFKCKHLKSLECSICCNHAISVKCHDCTGTLCKECLKNIYKFNRGQPKCPFCTKQINLYQLKSHNMKSYVPKKNRNINNEYIDVPKYILKFVDENEDKVEDREQTPTPKYPVSPFGTSPDENYSKLPTSREIIIYNLEKYKNNSDYDSGSEHIKTLDFDKDNNFHNYDFYEFKNGFNTSIYQTNYIRIQSFNKNRFDIILPLKLYNSKYIFILYLILIRMGNDTLWNNFSLLLTRKVKCKKFVESKNEKKKFLWNKYLEWYDLTY